MPKLIINRFDGGLAPRYFDGSQHLKKVGAEGSYAGGLIDPFWFNGLLTPPVTELGNPTGESTLVAERVLGRIVVDDSAIDTPAFFAIEEGPTAASTKKIHKINSSTGEVTTAAFATTTLAGAHSGHTNIEGASDIVVYQKNGSKFLFYSWCDATDGDVGIITTAAASQDEDFMTTTPTGFSATAFADGDYPIILEVADNNYLYMCQKNFVHKYDGTTAGGANGTFTANAIDLPVNWTIRDARDGRGKMWILATNSLVSQGTSANKGLIRQAGVFVWDRITTGAKFEDFLPINGASAVHALFFFDGVPHVFTSGHEIANAYGATNASHVVELRAFNGREFEVIKQVGVGNNPHRNGVTTKDGMITWLGADGYWYSYGKAYNEIAPCVVQIGKLPIQAGGTTTVRVGSVVRAETTGSASHYFASYYQDNASTPQKLSLWNPFDMAETTTSATYKSLVKELPKLSRITGITIYYPTFTSAASDTLGIKLYKNYSSSSSFNGTATYASLSTIGWKYFPITLDNTNAIQVGIEWTSTATAVSASPRISRIEIDYITTTKLF